MKTLRNAFIGAVALGLSVAASAQGVTAGAAVKDTSGGAVGTIVKVDGDHYVVKTDRHEVRLPATSFTKVEDGLLFGMTQVQLNAAVDQAKAAAEAKIAVGAAVTGAAGAPVGTIESLEDGFVTLKLSSGALVRVPRSSIGANETGVVTGATLAELEAAARSAAEATPQ